MNALISLLSLVQRLIENTRNSKSSATIVGLEKLISELETEEKEWEKVEKLLPNGIERISETLLDRGIEEKINAAPELHPDGSMNDQITQALYAQTEKVRLIFPIIRHSDFFLRIPLLTTYYCCVLPSRSMTSQS